jgi:hypothetical protein
MAFVRRRASSKKHNSFQLIETYRENGKVRQRVLLNLGRSATIPLAPIYSRSSPGNAWLSSTSQARAIFP